jgi:hypothetical protein
MTRPPSGAPVLATAFLGAAAAGFLLWSRVIRQSRRNLFSRNPVERVAALSYLGARPSVETARLLRDYLSWESSPLLRRRARSLLGRLERDLL